MARRARRRRITQAAEAFLGWDPFEVPYPTDDPDLLAHTRFGCLLTAWKAARRGKPKTPEMDRAELNREPLLLDLQRQLRDGSWQPGAYRQFTVRDPRPRLISAASFLDRVVHHVVMGACGPRIEAELGEVPYANRQGLGTHAAIAPYQTLAKIAPWVLTLDVSKYFASIDHALLLQQLAGLGLPPWQLILLARIVLASPPAPEVNVHFAGDDLLAPLTRSRGLPLGNLTSQTLANFFLVPLDRALASLPGVAGVIRYVDDLVVLASDRQTLVSAAQEAEATLAKLRLRLARSKVGIHHTAHGIRFLGYVVRADGLRLPGAARVRFERRIAPTLAAWRTRRCGLDALRVRVAAWLGHAKRGMTEAQLRRYLLRRLPLGRTPR